MINHIRIYEKSRVVNGIICFLISVISFGVYAESLTINSCDTSWESQGYKDVYYEGTNSIYLSGKISCYIDVAVKNKDLSICANLQSTNQIKLECYKEIAENYTEPSICENVLGDNGGTISLKNFCYKDYSIDLNDSSTCEKIGDNSMKDECFSKIAISTKNSNICDKIKDSQEKEICYETLGIFSGKCAKEGEKFSRVYKDQYPTYCCEGLTAWDAGMDTREVKNGKCVETGLVSGNPVGICINCGNNFCDKNENICNCPGDCENNTSLPTETLCAEDSDCIKYTNTCGNCEQKCGTIYEKEIEGSCKKLCSTEDNSIDCICKNKRCIALDKETFNLSNGRNAEVKIMPETASERAIERLGELNFTVELKQVGTDKNVYEVSAEKEGKIFGLFRAKGKVQALVNAETGDVEKINKPWWAFLATGI